MLDESKLQKGELKSIALVLNKMQSDKRLGMGVPCVQSLVKLLRKGMVREAIECARNASEDLWEYPEIRRFVHDVIYPIGYLDPETGMLVNEEK